MDALDVETSITEGEQALQALLTLVRERAGTLEAHEAEKGLFKRLLPIGLAAMKLDFAQRGTGEMGPAITRADGVILPQENKRRGRDDCSYFVQEWMTLFEVEHPFQERASWFEQLFDLEVAESVVMAVAQEAPADDEGF
jgi:hypothetical protein